MSISRFSLRDKVTLRLLKLYSYIADVVEWSRVLDILVLLFMTESLNSDSHLFHQNETKRNKTKKHVEFFIPVKVCGVLNRGRYIYIYIYIYIRLKIKPNSKSFSNGAVESLTI
jgi:hypothetical protein